MYRHSLGRTADPSGLDYWESRLVAGTSRRDVAAAILGSTEAGERRIRDEFARLLGRAPDGEELRHWRARWASGVTTEELVVALVASSDF